MDKKYQNLKDFINYSKDGILSKVIAKAENKNITLFCMAKGTDIGEHTSTKEGFVFVVEGKGIFNLEGEDIKMSPGVIIFLGKDAVHSLKAEENTAFLLSLN